MTFCTQYMRQTDLLTLKPFDNYSIFMILTAIAIIVAIVSPAIIIVP